MRACHHGHMARTTRQRAAVRAVFQDLDGFHSAQEVHARLRDAGDPVGLSTVYRAVQSLADDGELDSIRTDTGEAR
jgi:Fur family ferric uptake transcriptional regulator